MVDPRVRLRTDEDKIEIFPSLLSLQDMGEDNSRPHDVLSSWRLPHRLL